METVFGLKFLSKLYNRSYKNIADYCVLSKAAVQKWMDKERVPSEEYVEKLAEYFGVRKEFINRQLTILEQELIRLGRIAEQKVDDIQFIEDDTLEDQTIYLDGNGDIVQTEKVHKELGIDTYTVSVITPDISDVTDVEIARYEECVYETLHHIVRCLSAYEIKNECVRDTTQAEQILGCINTFLKIVELRKDLDTIEIVLDTLYEQQSGKSVGILDFDKQDFVDELKEVLSKHKNN
ncbi:MAG: helix-turn-helix transcriptional regulator [Clostridiales bacterium]|nr:helix-turn-helix transcriptional regulator [Clostridiales bacterium]